MYIWTNWMMNLTTAALGLTFLGVVFNRGPVILWGLVAFVILLFLPGQVDYYHTRQQRKIREAKHD